MQVIFLKSRRWLWRASTYQNTFMNGLTWCLASNRKAVKLWQLRMVPEPQFLACFQLKLLNIKFNLLSCFVLVFHPLTYEGGIDCDRCERKSDQNYSFFQINLLDYHFYQFFLCPSWKHRGHRSENSDADADPGVRPDAQTALHQPTPSEDHTQASEYYPELKHQLHRQWAVPW